MKRLFAALRFCGDKNIADKVYWYLCGFAVSSGERVLAPVGAHNRLQCARVEQTKETDEQNAPYDMRLIKKVAAKYGARGRRLGGFVSRDLGGVRYDNKHYTRYGVFLLSESAPPETERLKSRYGVLPLEIEGRATSALYARLAREKECVLLYGSGAEEAAENLLALACGEDISDLGITQEEYCLLKNKLR